MKDLKELFEQVVSWAGDRNLIDGSNAKLQFCKLVEENWEMCSAENDEELLKEIGDYHVVSIIMLAQLGFKVKDYVELSQSMDFTGWEEVSGKIASALAKGKSDDAFIHIISGMRYANTFLPGESTIYDALLAAFKKIEHRKGEMRNGVFIKEQDL